jgi:hypothetical protein
LPTFDIAVEGDFEADSFARRLKFSLDRLRIPTNLVHMLATSRNSIFGYPTGFEFFDPTPNGVFAATMREAFPEIVDRKTPAGTGGQSGPTLFVWSKHLD